MRGSQIDRILKKKGWTGAEVGKALIASVIHDIKHQGDPNHTPLFTQADFDKMESSLVSDKDFVSYGVYRDIYSSLIDAYNRGQGLYQQFYNGYSRYSNAMLMCHNAEEALKKAEYYPLVMTRSQYNRYRERAIESLRRNTESFHSLMFHTLKAFISEPEKAPADIQKLIEATETEQATNQRILSQYNTDYGVGYYTLPDGRRSDKLSKEDWKKALEELYLDYHKLTINGEPATAEEIHAHYRKQQMLKTHQLFWNGVESIKALYREVTGEDMGEVSEQEEKDLMDALEDILTIQLRTNAENERKLNGIAPLYPLHDMVIGLIDGTLATVAEWHYSDTPPKLTKYEVLEDMIEHYSGVYADEVSEEEQIADFVADYPALYSALEAYIKKTVPALASLSPSQYADEAISWGELADMGFIDYKELVEPDNRRITGQYLEDTGKNPGNHLKAHEQNQRAFWRGIAILQEPFPWQVDKNGDYLEEEDPLTVFTNLDKLAETEEQKAEVRAYAENLFKPALRFLYAFNTLMTILGAVYDIEGLETVQLSTGYFESQLEGFNKMLYILYVDVYGDPAEQTRKRKIVKELFQPVDINELKPTQKAIDAVREELVELGFTQKTRKALRNFDRYIAILTGEGA